MKMLKSWKSLKANPLSNASCTRIVIYPESSIRNRQGGVRWKSLIVVISQRSKRFLFIFHD